MTTAVQDRAPDTATTLLAMLSGWVGKDITTTEDVGVGISLLDSAKAVADEFLNNPFEDSEGVELDIPQPVINWLVMYAGKWFVKRMPDLKVDSLAGDVKQEYYDISRKFLDAEDQAVLDLYRFEPGF